MIPIKLAFALLSLHPGGVAHHGHTWWTTELSTAQFDAQPGDTVNVFLVPDADAPLQCDDYGGQFRPALALCLDVDF